MLANGRRVWHCCVLMSVATGLPACRDSEPPPPHNRDLGSGELVLLPTAPVWHDPAIAEGRADWHPFRELQVRQPAAAEASPPPGGSSVEEPPSTAGSSGLGGIEAEIREMIAEYNEIVAEGALQDLLDYHVEEQHEVLGKLFEAAAKLRKTFTDLRRELEAKLPQAHDRITRALKMLGADLDPSLVVGPISVISDTEARADSAAGSGKVGYRFRLIDEEWYIEIPQIEALAAVLIPGVELTLAKYGGWVEALQSGRSPPEMILQQIEAAAQAAEGRRRLLREGGTEAGDAGRTDEGKAEAEGPDDTGGG